MLKGADRAQLHKALKHVTYESGALVEAVLSDGTRSPNPLDLLSETNDKLLAVCIEQSKDPDVQVLMVSKARAGNKARHFTNNKTC